MQVSSFGAMSNMQSFQQLREQMFAKADSDSSGALSLEEFSAIGQNLPGGNNDSSKVQSRFSELDTDGSGDLSDAELEAGKPSMPPDMAQSLLSLQESNSGTSLTDLFSTADADASGGLSVDEFTELGSLTGNSSASSDQVSQMFSQLDTDGDGEVTQEEMMAGAPPPPPMGGMNGSNPFDEADADASGDLSLEEFTQLGELSGHGEESEEQTSALFNSLDTDGNGVITQAELEAGRPQGGQTAQAAQTASSEAESASTSKQYAAMQFEAMIEKYLQSMFSSYGQNGLNSSTSLAA
ncbi:MAG: EF-hand domain-containing protein [Rhodospirillales bacterium]|nr:EF-hand domain-containing protein [Rhodospirillales bacterium]